MSFVDNENFEAVPSRTVADTFPQFAHFVNATVGSGVDFNDVHRVAGCDFAATGAVVAGLVGGAFNAVQATRHDASDGGFAGTALPSEDIAVGNARCGDGILQGGADMLLANEFRECLRAILPGDDLIHADENLTDPG